jgi:hypothetical protein
MSSNRLGEAQRNQTKEGGEVQMNCALKQRVRSTLIGLGCASILLAASSSVMAEQIPAGCNANLGYLDISKSATVITNGQTVSYDVLVGNDTQKGAQIGCDLSDVSVTFTCPAANGTPTGSSVLLGSGIYLTANPASATNFPTQTCVINVNAGVNVATVRAELTGKLLNIPIPGYTDNVTLTKELSVLVFNPCVSIQHDCVNGSCEDGEIQYSGVIENCGDEPLTNIMVVVATPSGLITNTYNSLLSPGGTLSYNGSYLAGSSPSLSEATVIAVGQITGAARSDVDEAECALTGAPSLNLAFNCVNAAGPGEAIQVSGTVSNNGPVTVSNIMVSDSQSGPLGGPITLAPGQKAVVNTSFIPQDCEDTSDSIYVSGNGPAQCGSVAVAYTNMVQCSIVYGPGINVDKSVTCPTDPWDVTIGVSAVVSNSGNVELTSVSVVDDKAGALSGPSTLAAGAKATYVGSYVPTSFPSPDTVTATGAGLSGCNNSNLIVRAQDDATCTPSWTPGITVTKNNICPTNPGDPIMFSGVVSNSGDVVLHDVVVTDDQIVGAVTNVATLGIGQAFSYSGSYVPSGLPSTNIVTATATVPGIIYNQPGTTNISASAGAYCDEVSGPCITRTPGYWFNHLKSTNPDCVTLKKAIEANGGRLDLGFICLPTNGVANAESALRQSLSFFPPSKKGLSPLCAARLQLGFHLVAAIANTAMFETNPASCVNSNGVPLPGDLIALAQQIAACDDIGAIQGVTSLLDEFNNSGDATPFPTPLKACKATAVTTRNALRVNVFTATNCGKTNNCAAGKACP